MFTMFECELGRALCSGVIETASSTFLVLIAVRHFDVPALARGILAATGCTGYLLSPLVLEVGRRCKITAARAAAFLYLCAAALFVPAAITSNWVVYVTCATLAMALINSMVAILTTLYQENYPSRVRGRLVSRGLVIRILTVVLFSFIAGKLAAEAPLGPHIVIACFALASACAGAILFRCPSSSLEGVEGGLTGKTLTTLWRDRLFRNTMVCWMFMGFGNLMMVALRVEYLANPVHGLALTAADVALFVGILPNIARFAFSAFWGRLFDRMNFFSLRIILNLCFASSILAFFSSNSPVGLAVGALIFGAANAGSDLAWSLWVTKFAPPEQVAGYMSVHVFLTGIRGVLAPLSAFALLAATDVMTVATMSVAMIVLANLWLLPELLDRRKAPAAA